MNHRPIYEIAQDIWADWGIKVSPYAIPYLMAMNDLNQITDMYGLESGKTIVTYFLGNASSWKGEVAKKIKKELKDLL